MGVALRDIIAEYKTPVTWEALGGIAAVDAHNALYQFLSIIRQPDGTPLMDQREGSPRTFREFSSGTPISSRKGSARSMSSMGLLPHSSRRPSNSGAWSGTRRVPGGQKHWTGERLPRLYKQARSSSKVDAEVIATSKTLIGLLGLPLVDAPSEGEAQAAEMVCRGDARYVVSQDYDTLLFGAPLLVRNLTVSGKRKLHGRTISVSPERIILPDLLNGLSLTRDDLIRIAILTGT